MQCGLKALCPTLAKVPSRSHHPFVIRLIQDLGVKNDFFNVPARSESHKTTTDSLWPCNLVYHLAEHQANDAINHKVQNMIALSATTTTLFSFCEIFGLISFYFILIMASFLAGSWR